MKLNISPVYIAAGAAIAAALVWVATRGGIKGAAQAIGGAAVDAVDGVVSGAVVGIGQAVGIPATNETECERARREGRTWDASFACPAKDFLTYLWE